MSEESNNQWIVFLAGGVIGLVLVGGLLFVVLGLFAFRSTSVSTPAPPSATIGVAAPPAAPPAAVIEVVPDPAKPTEVGQLLYDGKAYSPDAEGYAVLAAQLKLLDAGTQVKLVAHSDLSFDAIDAVMGSIVRVEEVGGIDLETRPDADKAVLYIQRDN